ncbi:hypothetical protein, partial [Crocosphaera sp. Alani8]|uniref:hypothetical protein n=1 Tax=Crocosphaera sp. Alani8 TaxID=3038952 RepID=UPI00313E9EBC
MSQTSNQEIGKSLVSIVISPDNIESALNALENVFDPLINNQLAQNIPFVDILIKTIKTGFNVKQHFFVKKLKRFLENLSDISNEDKKRFSDKINNNSKSSEKLYEQLIIYIDRLDEEEKADLVAKLFKAYIQKRIDQQLFFRLARAIEQAFYVSSQKARGHSLRKLRPN